VRNNDQRDIQRQRGIDRKMMAITVIGMMVVFTALLTI